MDLFDFDDDFWVQLRADADRASGRPNSTKKHARFASRGRHKSKNCSVKRHLNAATDQSQSSPNRTVTMVCKASGRSGGKGTKKDSNKYGKRANKKPHAGHVVDNCFDITLKYV